MSKVLFWIVVTALSLWALALAIASGAVFAEARNARDAFALAAEAVDDRQFETAQNHLQDIVVSMGRVQKGMRVLRTVSFVPYVGSQIHAADALTEASLQALQGAQPLLSLGADLVRLSGLESLDTDLTFNDLSSHVKLAVLRRVSAAAPELALARVHFDLASDAFREAGEQPLLPSLQHTVDEIADVLALAQQSLDTAAVASRILPYYGGLGEPHDFLILFLNNAELRPGGGFIGAYGELTMENGDIRTLETKDVYELDSAAAPRVTHSAPDPLRRYNAADKWFLRDANWSPDFAASAQAVLERYTIETAAIGQTKLAQGVIGFTPEFASSLLQITGPVTVRGQIFTSENVFDKLEYQVEYGYAGQDIPLTQRKDILADLVNTLKDKLYALPLSHWPGVFFVVRGAIQNKYLAFYAADDEIQSVLDAAGWSAVTDAQTPDVQMVVDANLASLKTDSAVSRDIRYEIFRNSSGQMIGRTRVRYTHRGNFDWKTTRYRTYTRLYVPRGSVFIRGEGALINDALKNPKGEPGAFDIGEDLGMTTFGAFTSVEPGAIRDLVFEYELAPQVVEAVKSKEYALTFFKQMGALNHALTLALDFDKKVVRATPAEAENEWGDDTYRLNTILDQDLRFEVVSQ